MDVGFVRMSHYFVMSSLFDRTIADITIAAFVEAMVSDSTN
jgi:hypothetical protein